MRQPVHRTVSVTLVTGKIPTGVLEALKQQARIAQRNGLPLEYLLANPDRDELLEGGLRLVKYRGSRIGPRADRFLRSRRLRSLERLADYDVVFVRYLQGLDLDPLAIFRGKRPRLATVHHTKDLEEFVSGRPSLGKLTRWAFERINGPRILRRVDGLVGVTDEIRRYEIQRIGHDVPSATIANGIDLATVKRTSFVPFDGRQLRLFFVGSDPSPWHGIERLLQSLKRHRGPTKIIADVVGNQGKTAGAVEHFAHAEVRFHGTLKGSAIDLVASEANLGVGSLGAYTKGLRQGCALKTREYVGRGLPFVYGYEDVDIDATVPFALRVPNTAEPLDLDQVIAFARDVSANTELPTLMARYAAERLDWSIKIRQLLAFANSL